MGTSFTRKFEDDLCSTYVAGHPDATDDQKANARKGAEQITRSSRTLPRGFNRSAVATDEAILFASRALGISVEQVLDYISEHQVISSVMH